MVQATAANSDVKNKGASAASEDEGWEQATTQVEVFWDKETGVCQGKLVGGKIVKSEMGNSTLYTVLLAKDCACEKGKGKEAKKVTAKAGEMVGVWGSAGLNEMNTLLGCIVKITPLPKQNLSGGRTFYPFDIKFRGARKAIQMVAAAPAEDTDDSMDDVPFS